MLLTFIYPNVTLTADIGGPRITSQPNNNKDSKIWASLIHLSCNMWLDWDPPEGKFPEIPLHSHFKPFLRFDETLWDDIIKKMAENGMNMLVLDLGDGVRYKSHPEIAVENAWSVEKLKDELNKLRELGLEPIPKMNFSTWHDAWLGEYQKMVSSETYYSVCSDLIEEVSDIFGKPRFFHLGMDEEYSAEIEPVEKHYQHQFTRKPNMYWHDLYFFIGQVEKAGSRPGVFFAERNAGGPASIYRKFPKSMLLTAWVYGDKTRFLKDEYKTKGFHEMSDLGFDQIPCGSNITSPNNFNILVDYCVEHLNRDYLLGFMMAPWQPTLESCRDEHFKAIEQVGEAIRKFPI